MGEYKGCADYQEVNNILKEMDWEQFLKDHPIIETDNTLEAYVLKLLQEKLNVRKA